MYINNDNSYELLKLGLDVSVARGKVIANNMANINTANFKKSYVSFEDNLKEETSKFNFKKTNEAHLSGSDSIISIEKDNSTSIRTDGNNVDLDLEKVNQASNTLMYNALITQANSKLAMAKSVIGGN